MLGPRLLVPELPDDLGRPLLLLERTALSPKLRASACCERRRVVMRVALLPAAQEPTSHQGGGNPGRKESVVGVPHPTQKFVRDTSA